MSAKKRVVYLAFIFTLALSLNAWSQITTGAMRGVVNDNEAKPVAGATVTISSKALLGGTRTAYTDEQGVFRFAALPIGTYSVEVTLQGFQKVQVQRVDVSLDQTANVPLTMKMATTSENLTVIGETPVIDVTESGLSTNYKDEVLHEVPTQRSFYDLMQVAPGVSASTGDSNGDRTIAFGSNMQSNSWNVDGLEATAPETGSAWLYYTPEAVEEIQVIGVGAPAEYGNHLGAVFNVVTKKGGNDFHGTASYFFQDNSLTGTNVTAPESLDVPASFAHFHREYYRDLPMTFGGPIKKDKLWFFGGFEYTRDASTQPGVDPSFAKPLQTTDDRYDIKLTGRLGDKHEISGFYHLENWRSPDNGTPSYSLSATYQERGRDHAWGGGTTSTLSNNLLFESHYAGWTTHDLSDSPTGILAPQFEEFSPPGGGPYQYSGGSWYPFDYITDRHQVNGKVTYYAEHFLKSQHEFRFGVQWSRGNAVTETAAGADGFYEAHYAYDYYGTIYNYFYRYYQEPYRYGAITHDLGTFLDDTVTLNDRLTLNLGVRFDHNTGDIPSYQGMAVGTPSVTEVGHFVNTDQRFPGVHMMTWNRVSPRLGFVFQTEKGGKSVVQGSFGVYYDHNVSGNWDFPSPSVTPFREFESTTGPGGPYDLVSEQLYPLVPPDPNIAPPRTLQYALGFEKQLGNSLALGAQYVYKDTTDLIGWEIIGGQWDPITFIDPFTGNPYTLLNARVDADGNIIEPPILKKGNFPFPEGIPDFSGKTDKSYWQKYHGVILTLNKRFADQWALNASYTWSKSYGMIPRVLTQTQFNPFYGSTGGSDPNQWINATGRLQGDRPNMFRIQGVFFNLPAGLTASANVDFENGRAYVRQKRVSGSILNQGGTTIILQRGYRLPSFQTIDISLGKRFALSKGATVRVEGTVYNILNADNPLDLTTLRLSDPSENFIPDEWVKPRRLQLRVGIQF